MMYKLEKNKYKRIKNDISKTIQLFYTRCLILYYIYGKIILNSSSNAEHFLSTYFTFYTWVKLEYIHT